MVDDQQMAIFKLNQDFNKNKEKILQYIKYAENWQVASVMCSFTVIACDEILIVAMIVFLLKYRKTMQAMLAAFLQMNTKNTGIQSSGSYRQNLSTIIYIKSTKRGRDYR